MHRPPSGAAASVGLCRGFSSSCRNTTRLGRRPGRRRGLRAAGTPRAVHPHPHAARTPGSCATWSRGPGPSVTDAPQVRGGAMTRDAVSPRGRCPPRLPGATCCCRFHSANRRGRLPGIFLRLVISAMEDAAGLRSHDRNAARLFSWGGREPRKEGDECGIKATASGEGAAARGSTPVN